MFVCPKFQYPARSLVGKHRRWDVSSIINVQVTGPKVRFVDKIWKQSFCRRELG